MNEGLYFNPDEDELEEFQEPSDEYWIEEVRTETQTGFYRQNEHVFNLKCKLKLYSKEKQIEYYLSLMNLYADNKDVKFIIKQIAKIK